MEKSNEERPAPINHLSPSLTSSCCPILLLLALLIQQAKRLGGELSSSCSTPQKKCNGRAGVGVMGGYCDPVSNCGPETKK